MRCFVNGRKKGGNRSDSMDEQIKAAYGYTDRQLEQEMDYALSHPDASPELNPPEDEFQRILSKAEQLQREADQKAAASRTHRRINRGKMVRLALAAAILGTLSVGGVVSVVGRSGFRYDRVKESNGDEAVAWRNTPKLLEDDNSIGDAYQKISSELNISVLKLGYMPEDMFFENLTCEHQRAVLKFSYNDHIVRLIEVGDIAATDSIHVSDRIQFDEYYNRRVGENIILRQNKLEGGRIEFSGEIMTVEAYYYFGGIMEESEFRKIIEGMYLD